VLTYVCVILIEKGKLLSVFFRLLQLEVCTKRSCCLSKAVVFLYFFIFHIPGNIQGINLKFDILVFITLLLVGSWP